MGGARDGGGVIKKIKIKKKQLTRKTELVCLIMQIEKTQTLENVCRFQHRTAPAIKSDITKVTKRNKYIVHAIDKIQKLTSLGMGYSSDSSMRTTWLILGLFSESGSTHLKAVKRARLRALVDGLASIFGSTTSSDRLLPTIIFSQSTRFTCKYCNSHHIKRQNLIGPNKNYK